LVPWLRFPEFNDAPGWSVTMLGEQGELLSSLTGKTAQHFGVGCAFTGSFINCSSSSSA